MKTSERFVYFNMHKYFDKQGNIYYQNLLTFGACAQNDEQFIHTLFKHSLNTNK